MDRSLLRHFWSSQNGSIIIVVPGLPARANYISRQAFGWHGFHGFVELLTTAEIPTCPLSATVAWAALFSDAIN
jgi:hypothetical protein